MIPRIPLPLSACARLLPSPVSTHFSFPLHVTQPTHRIRLAENKISFQSSQQAMQRGEKRSLPADGSPTSAAASAAAPGPPVSKKAKEKMPDFDWSADSYRLTWALVEELKKSENRAVLFPDQDNLPIKSGDTKEDAYRRIAKVVHPEAFNHDSQTSGSRMKNKTVAMWKEYSGYCRKLTELCTAHRVILPVTGPDESHPQEIQSEWRRINNSMPVFQTLRAFMPVRSDDKPKVPPTKMQLVARGSSTIMNNPFDEDPDPGGSQRDDRVSPSGTGPVQSSPAARTPIVRELTVGTAEGRHPANGNTSHALNLCPSEYLDLRKSYQEDVRLGIFTAAEAKAHIEKLDHQFKHAAKSPIQVKVDRAPPPPPSSSMSGSTPAQTPSHTFSPLQDTQSEALFSERMRQLGFTKPAQLPSFTRLSAKELFKVLVDHASSCYLEECRLDPGRRLPFLGIAPSQQPYDPIDIYITTRSGGTPLMHHPVAACATYVSSIQSHNHVVHVMDISLVVHNQASWPTTMWDFTQAIVSNAVRSHLSPEEIKGVQAKAYGISPDPAFRQRFQTLKEGSTVYDVLRTGWVLTI